MVKSKYNAKKVVVDGIKFDSKMESDYYLHLLELQKTGFIKHIELQPVYELLKAFQLNDKKIQGIKYKADFLVTFSDGSQQVIDVKGKETADFKIKKKLFEFQQQKRLLCITKSNIDGGWVDLEIVKKNRAARKKAKKSSK